MADSVRKATVVVPQAVATPVQVPEIPIPDSIVLENLQVRDTPLRDLLQALGARHGVNLLIDPSVTGSVTLNLKNVKLRDVIQLLAQENGLAIQPLPGAIKIGKEAPKPLPPPVEPACRVEGRDPVSVDCHAVSLGSLLRALSDSTRRNLSCEPEAASMPVTLRLRDLPLASVLVQLSETHGLRLSQRNGVTTFYRLDPAGGTAGAAVRSGVRLEMEGDSVRSVEVEQTPIAQVISALAARSSAGFVIYGAPAGIVTLKMGAMGVDKLLESVLSGTDHTFWRRDSVYYIGPSTVPSVSNSDLLVLRHIKAEEAFEALPQSLSRNAQIKVVKSHNGLLVTASRDVIDGIRQVLLRMDKPVPQILIEALVVDVDMDKVREVGLRLFLGKGNTGGNSRNAYPDVEMVADADDVGSVLSGVPGLRDIVNLPSDFYAKIRALEQEKILQVRSRPQISTLNGSEATLTVGQTQYFLLKTETDQPSGTSTVTRTVERFEKIDANVTLTVTPYVTGKGEITCDIQPDFSEPEGSFDSKTPPTLNHRNLKSKVRLRDGETIILGGLVKESVNAVHDQFPLLGSIPVLGWLFKNQRTVKSRSQLLIFVTPHVYYGEDGAVDPEAVLRKLGD